jgi:hypothetical protein
MRWIILMSLLAAVSYSLLLPSAADAEVKCPEGKTAAGDCVNPVLAAAMRQTAIIFSQPKISQTAFPVLPADDRIYRYPNQLIPSPLKPAPAWPGFE